MDKLINYAGPIDFYDIYKSIKKWCSENGFDVDNDAMEYAGSDAKIDHFIAQRKLNGFVSYKLDIYFEFREMKKRVVTKEGKPQSIMTGSLTGKIKLDLKVSYEDKYFKKSDFAKKMILPMYKKIFGKIEIYKYADECDSYLENIYNTIKSKLELFSTLDGY
jgi:hypothetical protein